MRQPDPQDLRIHAGIPRSPDLPGVVGHYDVEAELGRGGMGVVYRARDINLNRLVALKTPLPDRQTARERDRFLREAQAVARLSHPHIVPVFEVFEHDGAPWVAMELVEGRTLRATLREHGRLAPDDVIRHAEGLAEALEAAHAKHLLHRDINPNNIMFTVDGRAVLMDFGLVQVFTPAEESTFAATRTTASRDDIRAGTPAYMSPEQVLGKSLDARSDLFSFGAVLFEMCTATPAFSALDRGGIYDAILHHDVFAAKTPRYAIPPELEHVIRKALAKRPDERYQDASDLVADLRALRRRTESGQERIDRQEVARSRRAIAVLAVALVLLIAGLLWQWRAPDDRPLPTGVPRQVTTGAGWEGEPALSPDGSLIAYASDESGNPDIWIIDAQGGNALRLTDDPGDDRGPHWFPDGSAIAFVSNRSGRSAIWKVPRLGGSSTLIVDNAQDPAISPDGQWLAVAQPDDRANLRIAVVNLQNPDRRRWLTGDTDGLWNHEGPSWSPDGKVLCYSAGRDLWLVAADNGAPRRLTTDNEIDFRPSWSADGRYIYFSSHREGTSALWRVSTSGGRPSRLTPGTGPERDADVSRDGARLAYTTFVENPDLVFRNLITGQEQSVAGTRDEEHPALSSDGRWLVFGSDRWAGRFDLWIQPLTRDQAPAGQARRLTDHSGSVAQAVFSHDGKSVAYHRVLDGQRDVWIVPRTGGAPTRFTLDPGTDVHPDWSPDDSKLAFASDRSGSLHIWVAPVRLGRPAGSAVQLTSGDTEDQAPVWSPDGEWIAFIGRSPGGEREVWLTRSDHGAAPTRVTTGAGAGRVRWDPTSDGLLVSGFWNQPSISLRRVSRDGRSIAGFEPPVTFGTNPVYVHFDVSRDGRLLVFAKHRSRGDVWVMDSSTGSF